MKKQGMPVDSIEAAPAWREAHQNIARRKPSEEDAGPGEGPQTMLTESHNAARTRREIAEANLAEVAEAIAKGKLVSIKDVERAFFEAGRAVRDALASFSRRVSPTVAALASPADCEAAITRELRSVIEGLIQQLGQRIAVPAEMQDARV